jgi:hypothetical protein
MENESNDAVMNFYEDLGFEEAQIEDGLTALFFEVSPDGSYALLTNDSGAIPESLRQPLIFACYTEAGSFLWSTSFKNSYLLQEIWAVESTPAQKFEAVKNYRKTNETIE